MARVSRDFRGAPDTGPTKYDRMAAGYSSRYADPGAIAARQLRLLSTWGHAVPPGARILELGCADGFVTAELARAGYRVTAVDLSPEMVGVARGRLDAEDLHADVEVADVATFEPPGQFDAVLGLMWTFFSYVRDPVPALRRLTSCAPKVLVDLDPRRDDLAGGLSALHEAGSADVARRPFFVPQRYRLGPVARATLRAAERTPIVRDAILRRKFVIVLKGERT
jgi:SAM-dependent methyltransferase